LGLEKGKIVVDVSSWNTIDFEVLSENEHISGVIFRIGYTGSDSFVPTIDDKALYYLENLKKFNIKYGIYYYGYSDNEALALEEAKFVQGLIKEYDIKPTLGVYYDAEESWIGLSNYEVVVPTFVEYLSNWRYDVGVYGNYHAFYKSYLNSDVIKQFPLWVANWSSFYPSGDLPKIWQYSDSGSVDGIKGKVDMNVYY
ncbi:MAG: GH25 family lysozyme, partial [Erysipelotrichaceae bacterium]